MRGSATSRRRRILVIDHDLGLVELLRGLLIDEGYQPLTGLVLDAVAGLPAGERPELIILDVQFSQLGPDAALLARLNGDAALALIPLLLTATDDKLLSRTAASLGRPRTAWIAKPFDLDALLREVELLLAGPP
ncbi:MAG TPA: hypothetical protein VFI42_18095 [Thermomicrobiaceae bacterium]|nr:hypothetical protein [Thermomicrobiaceae bacterium]